MIEAPTLMWLRLCTHYIDDLLPYGPLDLCIATGDVVKFFIDTENRTYLIIISTALIMHLSAFTNLLRIIQSKRVEKS